MKTNLLLIVYQKIVRHPPWFCSCMKGRKSKLPIIIVIAALYDDSSDFTPCLIGYCWFLSCSFCEKRC